MTPTPTPAQLAKARAIAGQVTAPCYDDTCDGRGCDRHTAITTIAAALADAEQRGRQAGLREAAAVADNEQRFVPPSQGIVRKVLARVALLVRQLAEEGPSR